TLSVAHIHNTEMGIDPRSAPDGPAAGRSNGTEASSRSLTAAFALGAGSAGRGGRHQSFPLPFCALRSAVCDEQPPSPTAPPLLIKHAPPCHDSIGSAAGPGAHCPSLGAPSGSPRPSEQDWRALTTRRTERSSFCVHPDKMWCILGADHPDC